MIDSNTNSILCSLCDNKKFKSHRGLKIHYRKVHRSKKIINISSNNVFSCLLCPNTIFKKKSGWSRHKTLRHSNYNIPPTNLFTLSDIHINEVKDTLVYLIQSCLKLHMKFARLQTISAPLTESAFVSIFQNNINRYSICQQRYECSFSSYDAYNTLANIFNQENWGRRIYEHGQSSEVVLVPESTASNNKLHNSNQLNFKKPEMNIIWKRRVINDEAGNKFEAGWVTLKFLVGQFH
ncbi:13329_t:CDS:1 [Cetraspora pellucida]|uniref:13329_t:CDS:1 n=1 Tax=Cetraspora pellucida TaxID=1433469 RepID=A0ACA9K1U1_9GLOM|nr:13329_t:CDS:1 [Cetraspora pellucida]